MFVEIALVEAIQVGKMDLLNHVRPVVLLLGTLKDHGPGHHQRDSNEGDGVCSPTEIKVMRQVERVSQELTFDQYSDSMHLQDTHSAGNLDLEVDAAAFGVVVGFILDMSLEPLAVYGFRLYVRVAVPRFLRL